MKKIDDTEEGLEGGNAGTPSPIPTVLRKNRNSLIFIALVVVIVAIAVLAR